MLSKVSIIPTGNEILSGIVTDTNSPAIMQLILEKYSECEATRLRPIIDKEIDIVKAIDKCVKNKDNLVIIIGGSGGGHRHVSTLSEDYTHSAMLSYLKEYSAREIYGKNGHMWSKIVCGKKDSTFLVNVPGPYVEAIASVKTLMECFINNIKDEDIICEKVAKTVIANYPSDVGVKCVEI